MAFDNGVHQRQANAGAFALRLGSEVGFENTFENGIGNTRAIILDDDAQVAIGSGQSLLGNGFGGGFRQSAAIQRIDGNKNLARVVFHGAGRIGEQIHQHLMHHGLITEDWQRGIWQIFLDTDS